MLRESRAVPEKDGYSKQTKRDRRCENSPVIVRVVVLSPTHTCVCTLSSDEEIILVHCAAGNPHGMFLLLGGAMETKGFYTLLLKTFVCSKRN